MTYFQIIWAAAAKASVPFYLLYAICAHESRDFTLDYALYDNGSPSYGVCQIKADTARFLGWKGKDEMELRNPKVSVKYASLYLQYQITRYGEDWVKLAAAFNAGTYTESKFKKGCPRNLKYVSLVREKLDHNVQSKLYCGN